MCDYICGTRITIISLETEVLFYDFNEENGRIDAVRCSGNFYGFWFDQLQQRFYRQVNFDTFYH